MPGCPQCGSRELYWRQLSPFLGWFNPFGRPSFDVIVCAACGLTRFFANRPARAEARRSSYWRRLPDEIPPADDAETLAD